MDFELAKALKDAGFQQNGNGRRVAPPDKIVARRDDFAYAPTLDELIESLPDVWLENRSKHEFTLARTLGKWFAAYVDGHHEPAVLIDHGVGESPTEAVARLWLALREKRPPESDL
jgi:hypothetical protein